MMLFSIFIGLLLQISRHNYPPVFLIVGTAYLFAFHVIHMLAPRLQPVELSMRSPIANPNASS